MSTLEALRPIVARIAHCNEQDITADTVLKDIDADSLDWVQIIVATENLYDIEIDIEKMEDMKTVNDFITYVDSIKPQG